MNATISDSETSPVRLYRVDDLVIDTDSRRVTREGAEIPVIGLSFDLLLVLVRAAPKLVSVNELMERVWPDVVVGIESVSQRVKLLRQALGDDADRPRYIVSVRGHGYRIAVPVTLVPAQENGVTPVQAMKSLTLIDAPIGERASTGHAIPHSRRHHWRAYAISAGLLLFAVLILGWAFLNSGSERSSVVAQTPARAAVAVMPFVNMTGDAGKEYLGDGMTEELINRLSKVQGLKVPARTSSFSYKGRSLEARQVAKELGVGVILEGSVRSADERVRITAQLIDAKDGFHIWSETYDRKFTDLFKLQDELATAIVAALKVNMNGDSVTNVTTTPPTRDMEAYRLYLQGWSQIMTLRPQNVYDKAKIALNYFEQARVRDPKFAGAYSGLAIAHTILSKQKGDEHQTAAIAAARQALALDQNDIHARAALGVQYSALREWSESERHWQAALRLADNDGLNHALHAYLLMQAGHVREALQETRRGYELAAPDYFVTSAYFALANTLNGQDAEALKQAEQLVADGSPRSQREIAFVLSSAALHARRYSEAAAYQLNVIEEVYTDADRAAPVIKAVYQALADPRKASAAIALRDRLYPKQSDLASNDKLPSSCLVGALSYALIHESDVAYELANGCLDAGFSNTSVPGIVALWTPEMRSFRQDPRFQALATRLGLMDYWQQYGAPDECELQDGKLTCH